MVEGEVYVLCLTSYNLSSFVCILREGMTHSKQECHGILANNDLLTLERRAAMLTLIPVSLFGPEASLPGRTSYLIDEAC